MKTKIISGLFIISLIFVGACNWIDPALNVDPTSPKQATLATVLPTTQAGIAYVLGGDIDRYSSLFTQHHTGTTRQHLLLYDYYLNESDIDNAWNTMYPDMLDLHNMINDATAQGSFYYSGIAKILLAFSLGMWTDVVGDIPYSQAFMGEANKKPKYDTQESIYTTIQTLLSDGIAECSKTKSYKSPGNDDFIYKGDMTKWVKAAHALKARFFLHVKDYNSATAELAGGFAGNGDDFEFVFGSDYSASNPFFQFMDNRGDISLGPKLISMMDNLKDPRIIAYSGDTVYTTDVYPYMTYYTSPNSPVPFMSYVEQKFIEAECKLASGDKPNAYLTYLEAINASLTKFGVDAASATAYLANAKVAVGANNITLETIINQKYIALYSQMETWTDWRRTGFPVLTPIMGDKIPRRFIPAQSERLYNGANLSASTGYVPGLPIIFVKMWWDSKW